MFQLTTGPGTPFVDAVVEGLPNITTPGTETIIGPVDLGPVVSLLTNCSLNAFTYAGSLTTPPCREGVTWLIPDERLPITVDQFNALKTVIKFNSRYTQNALNDGNLLLIAQGNDTSPEKTKEQIDALLPGETFDVELER